MMKNSQLLRVYFTVFPLLAFFYAVKEDSVSVILEDGVYTCSFFGTLPDGTMPVGLALAATLTLVVAVIGAVYGITQKKGWLRGLIWTSLAAATLSVLPLLLRSEPVVLPHVAVAVILLVECLLAYMHERKLSKAEKTAGEQNSPL